MMFRTLLASLLVIATLLVSACSQQDSSKSEPATAKAAKQAISLETIAAQAKGFTVGSMMSTNTVYVFFDAQCLTAATCGSPRCPCRKS